MFNSFFVKIGTAVEDLCSDLQPVFAKLIDQSVDFISSGLLMLGGWAIGSIIAAISSTVTAPVGGACGLAAGAIIAFALMWQKMDHYRSQVKYEAAQ